MLPFFDSFLNRSRNLMVCRIASRTSFLNLVLEIVMITNSFTSSKINEVKKTLLYKINFLIPKLIWRSFISSLMNILNHESKNSMRSRGLMIHRGSCIMSVKLPYFQYLKTIFIVLDNYLFDSFHKELSLL